MVRRYTPAELADVAKRTAKERRLEAVRWWRDERDPWLLQIEAQDKAQDGQPDIALLTAFLGD
jgi:hypothetical protein